MSDEMNRKYNARNPYQGDSKRVLCICSAGLLRSPTTAALLTREPYNFNTRAAGLEPSFALVPVDSVLVHWADEIVVMTDVQKTELQSRFEVGNKPVHTLNVPDSHGYMADALVEAILLKADGIWGES